ncbi:endospore germination permease [Paenibacillus validus]|uniref:GerAB/ArcD/ProY family transporter n=1 Tax=Paenibacillus validus TaxID=44253 RepID=UPI000FDA15FD|nr:endospore germination permease [Paenibacillus validus]MED4602874.1 endospore germination permease [Paenibacillus validus]MED4607160.1 endospore germination permease [Paenibacillus validus]
MPAQIQIINHRQFAWLIASLLSGGGLISIQHELIRLGRIDAWLTYLFPGLYALLIGFVLTQLARRFPQKHLFEITTIVFGRWIGTCANLLILVHLWMVLMRDLRAFGRFIGTILLPNTPQEILVLLFVLLLAFYGRTSVEVVGRVNDLFFPFFFVLLLSMPFLLSNELDTQLIRPALTVKPVEYFYANVLGIGWFGDILFVGAFLHTIWSSKQIRSAFRHGTLIATFLLTLSLLLQVLVLGPVIPGHMVYPNYSLVQHIHITDFLDRVDLFILSIWYPITACKDILLYLAMLTGIASLLKERDYTSINSPVSLFLLLTTLLAFDSAAEVFSFGNYSSPVIILGYQPLLLAALLLFMRKYPVRELRLDQAQSGTPSPGKQQEQPAQGRSDATTSSRFISRIECIRHSTWITAGNVLLLLSACLVFLGIWLGMTYAVVGTLSGIGYAICLVGAVVTSHMEMRAAKKFVVRHSSQT